MIFFPFSFGLPFFPTWFSSLFFLGEGKREGCRDKGWGRWGGKIGARKNFFFPNVGKKTSLSYFYLPFLLNFATFSVQSSLPFPWPSLLCLLFPFPFVFYSLSSFPFPSSPFDFLSFQFWPSLLSHLIFFPILSITFLLHFPISISQFRYSSTPTSFTFSSVYYLISNREKWWNKKIITFI